MPAFIARCGLLLGHNAIYDKRLLSFRLGKSFQQTSCISGWGDISYEYLNMREKDLMLDFNNCSYKI